MVFVDGKAAAGATHFLAVQARGAKRPEYATVVLLGDADSTIVNSYDAVRSEPFRIDPDFDCHSCDTSRITDKVLENPDRIAFFASHCRRPPELCDCFA